MPDFSRLSPDFQLELAARIISRDIIGFQRALKEGEPLGWLLRHSTDARDFSPFPTDVVATIREIWRGWLADIHDVEQKLVLETEARYRTEALMCKLMLRGPSK